MNNNVLSIEKKIDEIVSLHNKGLFDEALKKTNILNKENPNNPLVLNAYGIIYASLEDFEKSIDCFSNAIDLEPKYIKAHNILYKAFPTNYLTVKYCNSKYLHLPQ